MEITKRLNRKFQKYKKYHNILLYITCFILIILIVLFIKLFINVNQKHTPMSESDTNETNNSTPTPTISGEPFVSDITVSPQPESINTAYPSQILNLTNWKLTLPTGEKEKPIEIKQPNLAAFQIDPWFISLPNGTGVRFRSPVNGVTTKGSDYPRAELREMTNSGASNASWNSNSGTHTMLITEAITALPEKKKHIVVAQIHDANEDVIVIRLDDRNLYINVDGKNTQTLDSNYSLGKRFSVKFVVKNGQTEIYYNGSSNPVYRLSKDYSDAYFKAGAYTQSNCSKEESSKCTDTNYGEVIIYQLSVTHE